MNHDTAAKVPLPRMSSHSAINRRLLLRLAPCLLVFSTTPAWPASATVKPAEQLVEHAANAFLTTVRNGGRREEFAQLFDRYVSMSTIAMFALGKYRRALPPAERERYVGLVNDMLLNTVTRHGKHVRGRSFVVTGSRGSIVSGYINHDGDRRTGVDMRMAEGRIADVRVEGIWLAFVLRQEFNRIIDNSGGDIAALIRYLENGASL